MNSFGHLATIRLLERTNLASTCVLLIAVLLLAVAYAIRMVIKGRAHFSRVEKQGGSALLSKAIMEMGYWWIQPLARGFVLLGVTPNQLSWASFFFGLIAGACLAFGHFGFGGGFALISGFLDSLDGIVARMTGVSSDAGEVLDATVDRYVEGFFLGGLIIYYHDVPALQILAILALLGSFMVSYSSAKAEALHVDPPKGSMRRPERALYLTLGAVLSPISISLYEQTLYVPMAVGFPMVFALGMIAVMANASAGERMWAIAKEMRRRESEALRASQIKKANEKQAEEESKPAPART